MKLVGADEIFGELNWANKKGWGSGSVEGKGLGS